MRKMKASPKDRIHPKMPLIEESTDTDGKFYLDAFMGLLDQADEAFKAGVYGLVNCGVLETPATRTYWGLRQRLRDGHPEVPLRQFADFRDLAERGSVDIHSGKFLPDGGIQITDVGGGLQLLTLTGMKKKTAH